jgi:predicted metalloprotease with PDZ domain
VSRMAIDDKELFSAPIIRSNYFQFIGVMMFVFPVGLEQIKDNIPVKLSFDLPSNFLVYSSFGNERTLDILASPDKIRDALFVAGENIRATKVIVRGKPVTITMEGFWPHISDYEFIDVTTRLLAEQRKTWHDDNFPHFLVHFLSKPSFECMKIKGTAHVDAFRATFPDACIFKSELKELVSHELMHMWIGKDIKVGEKNGRIDGKWFTEGITDYYGRVLAYRAGILTEDQYFSTLNDQLKKYYRSKERNKPLAYLVKNMFQKGHTNEELEHLPYQQGEIMAIILNKYIEEQTSDRHSLDNVILDMLAMVKKQGDNVFEPNQIEAIVNKYVPGVFATEYAKIENGGLFIAPDLPMCRAVIRYIDKATMIPGIKYSRKSLGYCGRWLNLKTTIAP